MIIHSLTLAHLFSKLLHVLRNRALPGTTMWWPKSAILECHCEESGTQRA